MVVIFALVLGFFESLVANIQDLDVELGGVPFVGDGAEDSGDGGIRVIFADSQRGGAKGSL